MTSENVVHPLWKFGTVGYRAYVPPETVEVRRSARRRRTVSAYRDGDKTIVLLPAGLSRTDEEQWVRRMLDRLAAKEQRRRPSDDDLLDRARDLALRYLDGTAMPSSVRWAENQRHRWGSCTPDHGTIRLSTRLRGMPAWVVDYVIMHELAHLLVPSHGPRFWTLVERYPRAERARGFLEGYSMAANGSVEEC
ncbi:metal-dependent hydrolase [Sphaerisporangium melleum]|uniref:Metal-dependent hydrolase n=1 Tax=Sphaerisporangium melleum TaxID=321316 RepID=A0A917RI73_9ACTN|nr:metal-dependent hydrolase [Sphaerisporangium melleum]GII68756.1 metal-dependent hydrolase [Sphaerisporangium melleum]